MKIFLQILFSILLVTQICFAQDYWSKIGDMPENRYAHTVDEINGKIYIVGGLRNENDPIPTTALIYDITTSNWTDIPLISREYKAFHTSCVIDGKLYIIGGWTGNLTNFGKMEMFNPSAGEWTSKTPMPTPRGNLACVTIDNKIYVIGGMDDTNYLGLKTLEMYDISTDTWTQLANMPTGRWGLRAIAVNGIIYVFGGRTDVQGEAYSSVEMYNPLTNTWTTKSKMLYPRYQFATCVLNGNIFIIGGWLSSGLGPIYDKVEIYNPETDEWSIGNPLQVKRTLLAGVVLDGKICVYGGARTTHPNLGTSAIYEFVSISGTDEEFNEVPTEFLLSQNFPNPFNPSTKLSYSIIQSGLVTLKVYDVLGTEIETLVDEEKPVGTYELNWNADNLPSGVYFYRLQAGSFVETRKMILLK